MRQFIQKVVIGKAPGHQPATLEVHGRIASILAAMEAATLMEKLLDAYAEELLLKRLEWQNIQVSVVAGSGFEPAAFRLW